MKKKIGDAGQNRRRQTFFNAAKNFEINSYYKNKCGFSRLQIFFDQTTSLFRSNRFLHSDIQNEPQKFFCRKIAISTRHSRKTHYIISRDKKTPSDYFGRKFNAMKKHILLIGTAGAVLGASLCLNIVLLLSSKIGSRPTPIPTSVPEVPATS